MESLSEPELRQYYNNYFPFNTIKEWISYGGKEPLDKRECAFWFDSERFNRWSNIDDMVKILSSPTTSPPERMEIGPVYTHILKERSSVPAGTFFAVHRELVFDIDSDDFKDIKNCCGDSEICENCWPYMYCALDCLTTALRDNFGFKHILPVFSGRRGVHLWVCDETARQLPQNVREAIVRYLNINETVNAKGFVPFVKNVPTCPFATEMLPACERHFLRVAKRQPIFTCEKLTSKVKSLIEEKYFNAIKDKLQEFNGQPFKNQWAAIKATPLIGNTPFKDTAAYYKLIFSFTFPRLDANVTITMNHLLKSPFSFHPKSGMLSLPIPSDKFKAFPPSWVPRLKDLLHGNEGDEARTTFEEAKRQFEAFQKATLV